MNERIRELARQSGGIDLTNHTAGGTTTWIGTGTPEFLERFAELIRADEREACAVVCEERVEGWLEALQDMVVAFGGGGVTESQSDRVQALNRACQILKEKNTSKNISELKNENRI